MTVMINRLSLISSLYLRQQVKITYTPYLPFSLFSSLDKGTHSSLCVPFVRLENKEKFSAICTTYFNFLP